MTDIEVTYRITNIDVMKIQNDPIEKGVKQKLTDKICNIAIEDQPKRTKMVRVFTWILIG